MSIYNGIMILGPTASGKTSLACEIAAEFSGEIISVDSRQVYKKLNIGTGKDLHEYKRGEQEILFHLINVCDPTEKYFLHDFIRDSTRCYNEIKARKKIPVFCGGTGLYMDALIKDRSLTKIKEDRELRIAMNDLSKEELITELKKYPEEFHSHVDLSSKKRIIRGIEISRYSIKHGLPQANFPNVFRLFYIGIQMPRNEREIRIRARLAQRLEGGMVQEVKDLLSNGITHDQLQYFGLEYKFISMHLQNKLSYNEMEEKLFTAIMQFSKRQMTWFRKMEREGVEISWMSYGEHSKPLEIIRGLIQTGSLC